MSERVPIGKVLKEARIIKKDDVLRALEEQKRTGMRFGEALVSLGLLDPEDVSWALARQLDIPFVCINISSIDPDAVARVPEEIAKKHTLLPFLLLPNELTIIIDDPLKEEAIREVQQITGLEVKLAIGQGDEIEAAIQEAYRLAALTRENGEAGKIDSGGAPQSLPVDENLVQAILTQPISLIDLERKDLPAAIKAIGDRRFEEATPKLVELFFADPSLRSPVVIALAKVGGPVAEKFLLPATGFQVNFRLNGHMVSIFNKNDDLRVTALKGLGALGTAPSRVALKNLLRRWAFPPSRLLFFPIFRLGAVSPMIEVARDSLDRIEYRLKAASESQKFLPPGEAKE